MKEIYSWVPWFRELAKKIAEGGEAYLIEKAKLVAWGENPTLLRYGDEGIDPFSFFYFLASKNTKNQRQRVYDSVSDVFDIESSLPDTDNDVSYIFPTPQSNAHLLFHERENFTPDLLWRLYKETVQDNPKIGPDDFKNALEIKYTGVSKLTQTLFLINPKYFLPVDNSTEVLSEALGLPALSKIENEIKDGGYEKYLSVLKKIKKAFPGCQPYEINMFLYLQKSGQINNSKIFQIDTIVNRTDSWDDFKENNWVYTSGPGSGKPWGETGDPRKYHLTKPKRGDIILVRTGRQKKGRAIGLMLKNDYAESGLNENSRIHVLWINKSTCDLSGHTDERKFREAKPGGKTYLAFEKTDGYKPSFHLINSLTGNSIKNGPEPDIDELPKPDTSDTLEHLHPLNQILYGPPGTGKTWNTVNRAVAIIEGKSLDKLEGEYREEIRQRFDTLKEDGQIEMVTFHQNFTYEDFIEGIRPVLDDEDRNIEYELSEGVFRKIADRANKNRTQSEQTDDKSWDTDELLQAFAESIEVRLDLGEKISLFPPDDRSGATIGEIYWSRDEQFKSVQLGGTVKYQRLTKNVIKRDYEAFYKKEIKSPKDIKPTHKSKRTQHGNAMYYFALYQKIKQFHDEEWQPEESVPVEKQNYVLIIDEINRGNIARIFGELITLIEPSKRIGGDDASTVTLPYSKDSKGEFGVPDNLYIIGTMNTADRSIALLDTALRRRFEFIEMMPNSKLVSDNIDDVDCQKLLDAMNDRIRFLLDREHQIGHTYFMDVKRITGKDSLETTFKNKIIPLLQEYFYDNYKKIDLVLNKNGFIEEIDIPEDLRGSLVDDNREVYELLSFNSTKWKDPKIYQDIYQKEQGETE